MVRGQRGGPADDEIRPVPQSEVDREYARRVTAAMEADGARREAEIAEELKALEKVHARHAAAAENAVAAAGVDTAALKAELAGLKDLPAEQAHHRMEELAAQHRQLTTKALAQAKLDQDSLAREVQATVARGEKS